MTPKITKVRKAVLPVAGLGTRFLPATKAQPKEMLPVVDKPLIQYAVEECIASGIENIIFVTGRKKTAIEDHFDSAPELERFLEEHGKPQLAELVRAVTNNVHFSYTRQKEALGLGRDRRDCRRRSPSRKNPSLRRGGCSAGKKQQGGRKAAAH